MNPQPGGQIMPGQPWMPPTAAASISRRPRLSWTAPIATVIAMVALAVAIAALVRSGTDTAHQVGTPQSATSVSAPSVDTSEADRALCTAVAPLLRERADTGKSFVNTGETGTPARDDAIPGFRAAIEDWAGRVKPILDNNTQADAFLLRTLQRLVDDTRLYAENIRPGPETEFDKSAWNDSVVAYGGPFFRCHELGVTW